MNLIIDIGNTRVKVALFDDGKMVHNFSQDSISLSDVEELRHDYPLLNNVIVSSGRLLPEGFLEGLNPMFDNAIELTYSTPVPIQNLYKTPETLGPDRLAAAAGANYLYPNQTLLIVDAGTAITYEFISSDNEYMGGNISPGLAMRFKALHHFTGKLPLLSAKEIINFVGQTTSEAIIQGVVTGMIHEIEGYINRLRMSDPNAVVILTGGDAIFFDKQLKNSIFVDFNLIMYGLNRILEFNAK